MNSGMKKRKPTIPGMSGSNAIQNSILFNHMSHHYRFVYGAEKHVDSSPPDCLKRTVHRKNSIAQRPAKISAFHAECSTENQSPQLKAQTVGLKTRYMGKTTQLNCSGTFCQASVIPCPKRKGAESSDRQKQKFSSPQKPFEPRILHNDAQSKLRTMKVYHPPRKRSQPSAQSSRDTSSDSPQQQQDSSPVQQLQESSPVQQLQEAPPVQQVQKPSPLEKIAKQKQTTYKCKQNTSHKSTHQKHKCQEQSQELVSKASHHCNQQLSDSSQHSPQQQAQKKKRQAWLSRSKSSSKQKKLSSQEIQKQPLREETHNQDEQEDEALSSTASSGPWQTPYAENSSSPGTTAKSESKVSSRDSAYNGGISSGGESRGPTPEHKCDSTKCRSRVLLTAAKAGFTGCKLGLPQNEESMYVQFVHDITQDILLRGSYSNSSLQQLFQKHINQNKNQLNLVSNWDSGYDRRCCGLSLEYNAGSDISLSGQYLSSTSKTDVQGFKSRLPQNEESIYVQFVHDITQDILMSGTYSNRSVQQVFKRHINLNKSRLNMDRMKEEIAKLQVQLDMPVEEDIQTESALPPTTLSLTSLTYEDLHQMYRDKASTPRHIDDTLAMTDAQIVETLVEIGFDSNMASEICQALSCKDLYRKSDVSGDQVQTKQMTDSIEEPGQTAQVDIKEKAIFEKSSQSIDTVVEKSKGDYSQPVGTREAHVTSRLNEFTKMSPLHQPSKLTRASSQKYSGTGQSPSHQISRSHQSIPQKNADIKESLSYQCTRSPKQPTSKANHLENIQDSEQKSSLTFSEFNKTEIWVSRDIRQSPLGNSSELIQIEMDSLTDLNQSPKMNPTDLKKLPKFEILCKSTNEIKSPTHANESEESISPDNKTSVSCVYEETEENCRCESEQTHRHTSLSPDRSSSHDSIRSEKSSRRSSTSSIKSDSDELLSPVPSEMTEIPVTVKVPEISSYYQQGKVFEEIPEEDTELSEEEIPEEIEVLSDSSIES